MSSIIRNKLLDYEAYPSRDVWHRIALNLDQQNVVQRKLHLYEKSPSPLVWAKIKAQLEQPNAKVVPFYHRYRKPLRYSGAVVALVSVAFVASLLIGKKTISEERPPTLQGNTSQSLNSLRKENNSDEKSVSTPGGQITELGFRRHKTTGFKHIMNTEAQKLLSDIKTIFPLFVAHQSVSPNVTVNEHYMVYSDDSGKVLRLPKKLYESFACPLTDETCRERILGLQQRTASSAMASDFTGVVDILNNLRENQ